MVKTEIVKSVCGLCGACCGVVITLHDGQPVGIKGDPESPPNRGELCKIGLSSLEYLNHPDRLKHPLKRKGGRGGSQWEQISWDEAFGLAADGLTQIM
jgi:thiosulfate reductase/polysulfide reductase chain A